MEITKKANILVIDDSPAKRLALLSVLEDLNHNLVGAESGRDALRLLLKHDYAVILLDVQMPGMDGFETARIIRSRVQSEFTPVIFVTAYARTEIDMLKGYSQGAVDYVFMPIIPEILRAKVSVFVDLYCKTQEIKRHEQQLREKNLELEAANQELAAFSHSVAHDLRTPLATISGFTGLLQKHSGGQLDSQGQGYLGRVRNAAGRMSQLIDDILQLSQITRSEINREETDLSAVALDIVVSLRSSQPDRQVTFTAGPATAQCDPRLLRVALENLLGNAWKFTGKREQARIESGLTETDGEPVYFVRDNGAGFDMVHAEKLFSPFQRLHSESEFSGTGIGLATVQRIVKRHHGRIWAEAEPDKGSTFYFTLSARANDPDGAFDGL